MDSLKKKKILFIGEDLTLAHVIRPFVLANSLDPDNFEIVFASGGKYASYIKNLKCSIIAIQTLSSRLFFHRLSKGQPIYTVDEIRQSVEDDLRLFKEYKPDIVVGDFRLSLGISTLKASVPYISLSNAFWSEYSTTPFPTPELPLNKIIGTKLTSFLIKLFVPFIFRFHARPFNKVRSEYGLPSFSNLKDVYTYGDWTLYLDIPLLAPTSGLPDNHNYLGPLVWSPDDPLPTWWDRLPDDIPVIYVTAGSSGDTRVVGEIIKAIEDLKLVAMISTAGRFNSVNLSKNIFEENFIPGTEAAKRADIVICNGGTATTYQALACGTPVIGIPFNADQYLFMHEVVKQGAGAVIRSGQISCESVKESIKNILENQTFKDNAIKIQKEIEELNLESRFSEFISRLSIPIDNYKNNNR